MTVQPTGVERRADGVARRVRGLMGEQRITGKALAMRLGISQPAASRRTTGELEFSVSELERLADLFGVSEAYLYGFTNDRTPDRLAVGGSGSLPRLDSNQQPSGYRPRRLRMVPPLAPERVHEQPAAQVVNLAAHRAVAARRRSA
jgi:transcriptional regulator with XRE-family HTH domain